MALLGFIDQFYLNNGTPIAVKGDETTNFEISIYEVFKVVSGIPLFFEDHIERLENSLTYSKIEGYKVNTEILYRQVVDCCNINNKLFGNIELRISKPIQGECICLIGFIPHNYPSPITYIEGVTVGIMEAERMNPNAKVKHSKTRIRANKYLKDHNHFEVLLENQFGEITEGSRSNVFFIKGNSIHTAPLDWVLPGITRKYVLNAIDNIDIQIERDLVKSAELKNIDAAFLCGTSIGILPIKKIGRYTFDTQNLILKRLMLELNDIISKYLSNKSV